MNPVWRRVLGTIGILVGAVALVGAGFGLLLFREAQLQAKNERTENTLLGDALLLEIHARVSGRYPSPGYRGPVHNLPESVQLEELGDRLSARHRWATTDAWGHPLWYASSAEGKSYELYSTGSDGLKDIPETAVYSQAIIKEWASDVVVRNGELIRWRADWCCNPQFQAVDLETLEVRARRGELGE